MPDIRHLILATAATLVGCTAATEQEQTAPANSGVLPQYAAEFSSASMIGEPRLVDCTLSGGTQTTCVAITLAPAPAEQKIGPFCPRNIADGPKKSGIWLEAGKVYDADGAFIERLAEFYDDPEFTLHDPDTGEIRVTDSKISCEAAARPDVDPEYRNHCVECSMTYIPEGSSQTYFIPVTPVKAETIARRVSHSGVGIGFSGVRFDAPAPTDAILSAHTLAPFDDCGGHINPLVGYHIHAVTDCGKTIETVPGHARQIGVALDGYAMLERLNPDGLEPADLDQCRGHSLAGLGYHYHVAEPGVNAILPCHTGETGCASDDPDAICDASKDARRGPPH